jgi:large subunit ribosomal protein L9
MLCGRTRALAAARWRSPNGAAHRGGLAQGAASRGPSGRGAGRPVTVGGAALKVILVQDVPSLGKAGQSVDVAEGYARNYLMPRHLAEEATPGALRRWAERERERARHQAHEEAEAKAVAERLDGRSVRIPVRVGEGGRTFGSVTAKDVAEAVERGLGVTIDRRRIQLEQPLRSLGAFPVEIHVHPKFHATIEVVVEEART